MIKRLQNKISESRLTLPLTAVYAACIWLLYGGFQHEWWGQLACLAASIYLMIELNNSHALIRIYSRMVSSSFIMLSCAACFLFPSLHGAAATMLIIASYIILFHCYQDPDAVGKTFYAFVFFGLASFTFVHVLYYLPFLLLFMGVFLQMLSGRTLAATLLGLITPYWFAACYCVYTADFHPFIDHFVPLATFQLPFAYHHLSVQQIITFALVTILMTTGIVHYIRQSYNDKIRIRMLYAFFIWMDLLSMVFIILQPQHYDGLMRMMIVNTSPLIAHFIALTHTKTTNIAFYIIVGATLSVTIYHLWISLSTY